MAIHSYYGVPRRQLSFLSMLSYIIGFFIEFPIVPVVLFLEVECAVMLFIRVLWLRITLGIVFGVLLVAFVFFIVHVWHSNADDDDGGLE